MSLVEKNFKRHGIKNNTTTLKVAGTQYCTSVSANWDRPYLV